MNRRILLAGCFASIVAGCTPAADGTPDVAQVIADAQAVVTSLVRVMPSLAVLVPPAKAVDIQKYLGIAQNLLGSLSTSVSDTMNATTLLQIEDAVNSVLAIVAAIPGVPPEVAAVAILLPIIEVFINSVIPQSRAVKVARPAVAVPIPMTPAQARATLKKGK